MLYRHEIHGWKDAVGQEIIDMEANGWVKSNYEEFAEFVAQKSGKQKVEKADTIEPVVEREATVVKGKPGRKPKSLASLGGSNGNISAGN